MVAGFSIPRITNGLAMAVLLAAGTVVPVRAQVADGQDTRLRLDQQLDRQRSSKEERALEEAAELDVPASLEIDGKSYSVENNVDEMGQALYIAIARRQWRDVRRFLNAYQRFPDRDQMLVLSAEAALARQEGDLELAERQYRDLLKMRPDFLPGQLELARVLFENRKEREAQAEFEAARALVVAQGDRAKGILRTVDAFLAALRQRRGWQGSLAIGPGYSTNLNQSSASYACLLQADDGACLIDRKVPDPIKATGINFEGTLSRQIPLSGHHGIRARVVTFGDIYPDHHDYSQATVVTRVGYQYQTARNILSLSPTFELGTLRSSILYDAWGASADWQHTLSQRALLRLEANYRDLRYRREGYTAQDGPLIDVNLTAWYAPSPTWTLFGGPDFVAKLTDDPVDSYRQWGARIGVTKAFGTKVSLLLLGSYRQRDYRAYSVLFETKRLDKQINATAIARFPLLNVAGLVPELVVQHTYVDSNIDWLYSYKRTSASLRLSYAF